MESANADFDARGTSNRNGGPNQFGNGGKIGQIETEGGGAGSESSSNTRGGKHVTTSSWCHAFVRQERDCGIRLMFGVRAIPGIRDSHFVAVRR